MQAAAERRSACLVPATACWGLPPACTFAPGHQPPCWSQTGLLLGPAGENKIKDDYNAVHVADTPCVDSLRAVPGRFRTIKAHGTAVGLPSDDDMGNSEVGAAQPGLVPRRSSAAMLGSGRSRCGSGGRFLTAGSSGGSWRDPVQLAAGRVLDGPLQRVLI